MLVMMMAESSAGGGTPAPSVSGSTSAFGTRSTGGVCTSSLADMSVADGTGPFTYSWAFISGGTGITITSPTSQDTTFSGTVGPGTPSLSGTARITVTDSLSKTGSADVSVSLTYSL